MIDVITHIGLGYKILSYHALGGKILNDVVFEVSNDVEKFREH